MSWKIGLSLHASKTKTLHGPMEDDGYGVAFANMEDETIQTLHVAATHKYLGSLLALRTHARSQGNRHRSQVHGHLFINTTRPC